MLEREVHPEEQPTDAARVRVKPDELARAVAAVQARKEAEARYLAETVAIGETVQDLGLDLTPEEVLAEIEAQRTETRPIPCRSARRSCPSRSRVRRPTARCCPPSWWSSSAASSWPVWAACSSYRSTSRAVQSATLSPPPPLYSSPFHYAPAAPGLSAAGPLLSSRASRRAAIPCDPRAIGPLLMEYPRHAYTVASADHPAEGAWTLIKHGGRLYVRGWIARDALRQGHGSLTLFNYEARPRAGHARGTPHPRREERHSGGSPMAARPAQQLQRVRRCPHHPERSAGVGSPDVAPGGGDPPLERPPRRHAREKW